MSQKGIDHLIINSPFEEPKKHWFYIRETQEFELKEGRRKAGYWRATQRMHRVHDDSGEY